MKSCGACARRDRRVPRRHECLEPHQRHPGAVVALDRPLCVGPRCDVPPVRLELLFSARGPADYASFADELDGLPSCPLSHRVVDRAGAVQALLADRSQHRGPNAVDLFVAAIAEVNELTLVHYDRHFDAIARVTGQPTEWIAARGMLD